MKGPVLITRNDVMCKTVPDANMKTFFALIKAELPHSFYTCILLTTVRFRRKVHRKRMCKMDVATLLN